MKRSGALSVLLLVAVLVVSGCAALSPISGGCADELSACAARCASRPAGGPRDICSADCKALEVRCQAGGAAPAPAPARAPAPAPAPQPSGNFVVLGGLCNSTGGVELTWINAEGMLRAQDISVSVRSSSPTAGKNVQVFEGQVAGQTGSITDAACNGECEYTVRARGDTQVVSVSC